MAVARQTITDRYALYEGDCVQVMRTLPKDSIDFSVYSPPFSGLYNYSSADEDMSNCKSDEEFLEHYGYLVEHVARVTKAGRLTAVHCADVTRPNQTLYDLPGEIIRLHERNGFRYHARYAIWKEPLRVAIRTRALGLTHRQIVKDSSLSGNAGADYVLVFRKNGANAVPIAHPTGLSTYAGEREIPEGLERKYAGWKDPQTNKLAHWIWQQYASCMWDDIRINRVLPYRAARDPQDEKHVHPLQLDVIERCVTLWSNPNDVVLTPFMGVGSEAYGALTLGRRAVGIELKPSYFRQAVKNIEAIATGWRDQDGQSELGLEEAPLDLSEWTDPEGVAIAEGEE
jgi:DNA modification methylase